MKADLVPESHVSPEKMKDADIGVVGNSAKQIESQTRKAIVFDQSLTVHNASNEEGDDVTLNDKIFSSEIEIKLESTIGVTHVARLIQAFKQLPESKGHPLVEDECNIVTRIQQHTKRIGPLSARDATEIFYALDAILGRPWQSALFSFIMGAMKHETKLAFAGLAVIKTALFALEQQLHQHLAPSRIGYLGLLYDGYLKDLRNLKEMQCSGHERTSTVAKLKESLASGDVAEECKDQPADSKFKGRKKSRQTYQLEFGLASSSHSVLSQLKNYVIYKHLDDREKLGRQRESSISNNALNLSDAYGVQYISTDHSIEPDHLLVDKTPAKKLSNVIGKEVQGKGSHTSRKKPDSISAPRSGGHAFWKPSELDNSPMPSGMKLHDDKELLPIEIGKNVQQKPKNALREKLPRKGGLEFRNVIEDALVELYLPSKLQYALVWSLRPRQSYDWESSDFSDSGEERNSDRASLEDSEEEISNDFDHTPTDAESSHQSQGSNILQILSSNGITSSNLTSAQSITDQFHNIAAQGDYEDKSETRPTESKDVTEATSPTRTGDLDLSTDGGSMEGMLEMLSLLELENASDSSSLDDEDMSLPTRIRFVNPVTATSHGTTGHPQQYSEWIPVDSPVSSAFQTNSRIASQNVYTSPEGRISPVSPVASSYCFGRPLAHPQDESGPSVPGEQWGLKADHLGATGFTAGPNLFSPQNSRGTTATQTAVPDLSQSLDEASRADSAPVRLPPITVHEAGAIPPWATTTALIDLDQAANRRFAPLRNRRATFDDDWPNHSGIDAANMALAGFHHVGKFRVIKG